jgi:hypothetical protein
MGMNIHEVGGAFSVALPLTAPVEYHAAVVPIGHSCDADTKQLKCHTYFCTLDMLDVIKV